MSNHKKPRSGTNAPGLHCKPSITVRNSNTLMNCLAVFLFAALGAAFGHAVDGMAADLTAGPPAAVDRNSSGQMTGSVGRDLTAGPPAAVDQGGRADGQ